MKALAGKYSPLLLVIAVLVVWEAVCRIFHIETFILPPPSAIWTSLVENRVPIAEHSWQTFWTTMVGFAIAVVVGVFLGCLLGSSAAIYRACYPLLVGFNSVPKAAFVPILVVWFGIGTIPAVLTALIISFFPIVVNVATGLATLEPELEDVLRALGATRLEILRKVGFPRSLPFFFASLKVAITLAFVGTVISEISASNAGIGYLMMHASSEMKTPLMFAGVLVISVMAMAMYEVFAFIERRSTRWAHRSQQAT
ncbi:MAG TPA: ABC transporter permease [Burkholderiales bacterium]|jgi:NitT/TauT family transport system permease protein